MTKCLPALALFLAAAPSVFAFALVGPYEAWQDAADGYQLAGDFGGPKDLGDQYRWNIPILNYAYDASFIDFFGTKGQTAIDQSFAVFNNLTNFSKFSSNLTEVPLNTSRFNQTAVSLGLLDMKSANMAQIINLLGLNHPSRYTWSLHDHFLLPNTTCPGGMQYVVVQRNFDPISDIYSSYINGALIDYVIDEACTTTLPPTRLALDFAVDPFKGIYTAVADQNDWPFGTANFQPGLYYTGLTRDDIGGLRYLMSTNRIVLEDVSGGTLQEVTNTTSPQLLTTSDYGAFYQQALTNGPAALLALYPGLIILSNSYYYSNVTTTNINFYYVTNPVGSSYGTIALASNVTTSSAFLQFYSYLFGNVQTNHSYTSQFTTVQTVSFGPLVGAPYGNFGFITNTVNSVVQQPSGDFFLLPTNACGNYSINVNDTNIVVQHITTVSNTTNFSFFATNGIVTNQNFTLPVFKQTITYTTNNIYVYRPINCLAATNQLLEGMDHVQFVRVDYDSLLGSTWTPQTNIFHLTAVNNNAAVVQTYYRLATTPDIVIESADTVNNNPNTQFVINTFETTLNFVSPHLSADGVGPGNIAPSHVLVYGKGGGPIYLNGGFFASEANGTLYYNWGSFDGTTNAPVVFPDGTSLASIVNQVFFQILTTNMPDYHLGTNSSSHPYSVQLGATGGTPPYSFSIVTNTAALPAGLTLSTNGLVSGYGVPSADSGQTFDFQVQATDFGGRTTQSGLYINIKP